MKAWKTETKIGASFMKAWKTETKIGASFMKERGSLSE